MKYYIFRQKTMGVQGGAAAIDNIPDNIDTLQWAKENILKTQTTQEPLILDLTHDSGSFRGAIIDGLLTLYHKKLLNRFGASASGQQIYYLSYLASILILHIIFNILFSNNIISFKKNMI